MRTRAILVSALLVGCASNRSDAPVTHRSQSAGEHAAAAAAHERQAAAIDDGRSVQPESAPPSGLECADQPLAGIPETGGKPINVLRPCWTSVLSPDEQDRRDSDEHRRIAARHRAAASSLRSAEAEHCQGIGEAELSESPFWHRKDITGAQELRKGGRVFGATVRFRAVRGLSAEWLRRASQCHQARAAVLGYPPTFMAYCPLALPDTEIEVVAVDGGFELTVTSRRDEIAAAIRGRAADLTRGTRP